MFNPLTKSVAKSFAFYAKVAELDLNRRLGIINESEFELFGRQLRAQYFGLHESAILIERERTSANLLPPGNSEGRRLEELKSESVRHTSTAGPSKSRKKPKKPAKKPADEAPTEAQT